MHWVWRVILAVLCGFLLSMVGPVSLILLGDLGLFRRWTPWSPCILSCLFSILAYDILTNRYGPKVAAETETRCRACRYILRGISQPRCPECGEWV